MGVLPLERVLPLNEAVVDCVVGATRLIQLPLVPIAPIESLMSQVQVERCRVAEVDRDYPVPTPTVQADHQHHIHLHHPHQLCIANGSAQTFGTNPRG